MSEYDYEQIVIGAGMAGLACAGELVRLGEKPLLISETKEVGAMFAVKEVGNSRAFLQHLTFQPGWCGGWWFQLARSLNIPLRLYPGFRFAAKLAGQSEVVDVPMCVSAAAMIQTLEKLGWPMSPSEKSELERVAEAALAIPHDQLVKMHQIPLVSWLKDQGAGDTVISLFLTFGGSPNGITIEDSARDLSVYGGLSSMRAFLFGEAMFPMPYPNIREGVCIPIASEIQRRGGSVQRGRKVKRVLIEEGRVKGVALEDGTIIRSPVVAIATGNGRIESILDPIPKEIREPLTRSAKASARDLAVFAVLNKPVIPPNRDRDCVGVINPSNGYTHWVVPLHGIAPWLVEPGKQLLVTWLREEPGAPPMTEEQLVHKAMDMAEEVCPGFKDAIETYETNRRPLDFTAPLLIGPKLPRRIKSIEGLWFVGDGSEPFAGLWSEGAVSCGILGAREILGKLS